MNWRLKAVIQNLIDKLPSAISHPVYYRVQRNFGGLKNVNPMSHFEKSIKFVRNINKHDLSMIDKTFLEIGTGRTISVPIGLWLCGAAKIITVDLHKYLKEELVVESVNYIKVNKDKVQNLFGDLGKTQIFRNRLSQLMTLEISLDRFMDEMNIEYLAPADAASLPLEDDSVDFHYSTNVFEHISQELIEPILSEAKRILSKNGLFIHLIDLSDHFSHSDDSITTVNFLQYNEKQWDSLAGNKFMYHNRFRLKEFLDLFEREGATLLSKETIINNRALKILKEGIPIDKRFLGSPFEDLAVSNLDLTGRFIE